MLNVNIGDKVLVTCDAWFYAPDGMTYRGVYGTLKAVRGDQDTLGIKTNARSTNWYIEVGNMTIAGCQIHYVVRTKTCNLGAVTDNVAVDGENKIFLRPGQIYAAD